MKTHNLFPSIIKMIVLVFLLATGTMAAAQEIVSMKQHATQGLTCVSCHTDGDTKNAPATVQDNCIACHAKPGDTYYFGQTDAAGNVIEKEYPESGKTKMAAMHDSHGGQIRCTVCHTSHKEPEKLYCNNCHQFDVTVK